ncbi:MAG: hypothetical protein SFV15_09750 [Polyangiaceae bacterium]|nr:hypothetical protein [Polyangiaceae bacterium]
MGKRHVPGVLLLHHQPIGPNASTISEHVRAFGRHSRFPIYEHNTELGFPPALADWEFDAIVMHYSLFGTSPYTLNQKHLEYINRASTYKVAYFQDEHRYCQKRFAFLNDHRVNCVFTLLEPTEWSKVYQKYTRVEKLIYTLTGYVSEELLSVSKRAHKPDSLRNIDIGYRARRLDFYMGAGGQEKHLIAEAFEHSSAARELVLDIDTKEERRLYGAQWVNFLANCRGALGVETGVSVFDLEDVVRPACERLLAENPAITFEEVSARVLKPWEGRVFYRTVGPRHFEAAALRVCQIMFEGKYSGVMQAGKHYLSLKKDFSNLDEVIRLFKDADVRRQISDAAHEDLIASRRFEYSALISDFDRVLEQAGLGVDSTQPDARVQRQLKEGYWPHRVRAELRGRVIRPTRARIRTMINQLAVLARIRATSG